MWIPFIHFDAHPQVEPKVLSQPILHKSSHQTLIIEQPLFARLCYRDPVTTKAKVHIGT